LADAGHEQTLAQLRLLAHLPGYWELRALHRTGGTHMAPRGSFWIVATATGDGLLCDRLDQALAWADQHDARGTEVFVGVNARSIEGKTKAAVTAVTCCFADLDLGGESIDEALAALTSGSTPVPSLVVHGGYGLHAVWLLREASRDKARWRVIQQAIVRCFADFGADPACAPNEACILRLVPYPNRKLSLTCTPCWSMPPGRAARGASSLSTLPLWPRAHQPGSACRHRLHGQPHNAPACQPHRVVTAYRLLPSAFGLVQVVGRVFAERLLCATIVGVHGDACTDLNRLALDALLCDALHEVLQGHHSTRQVRLRQEQNKLVSSDACCEINTASAATQRVGYSTQQLIASRVAKSSIHLLEVVDVEEEQGHGPPHALGPQQLLLNALLIGPPVGEPREAVGQHRVPP
jgi:hypothetical protein